MVDAGVPVSGDELAPPTVEQPEAYGRRLDFRRGEPQLRIRLMEGRAQATFSGRGRLRLRLSSTDAGGRDVEKAIEGPIGSRWTVRVLEAAPAKVMAGIELAEFAFADKASLAAEQALWESRGFKVRAQVLGSVYGIAGKVIDNRRYALRTDERLEPAAAAERQAEIFRRYGVRASLLEELQSPATGTLELLDEAGNRLAVARQRIIAEPLASSADAGVGKLPAIDVKQVEYGVGYDFHGFEDRSYRGSLELTLDRAGQLAVVNVVPLEGLLDGLVPSEIFARAHPEALKAQAVTARGEVLAKIGLKHLADPYALCAEQHCAVYKGLSGEAPTTSAAVAATRGECLFAQDGRLVDSVYSAVCGGHTENNEIVWGGVANPNLRGRPDLLPNATAPSPGNLGAFLAADAPAACRVSRFSSPTKYRWEKRLSVAELDLLTKSLGIGRVRAIAVGERGISGRAKTVTLSGEEGATTLRGELNIRRQFGMLNSAMFVVTPERGTKGEQVGWLFKGGGWGHGVGMCQTGAIGRAEAGQSYRAILDFYFSGAQVSRIY